jgi:hypothetical protein
LILDAYSQNRTFSKQSQQLLRLGTRGLNDKEKGGEEEEREGVVRNATQADR